MASILPVSSTVTTLEEARNTSFLRYQTSKILSQEFTIKWFVQLEVIDLYEYTQFLMSYIIQFQGQEY